MGALEIFLLIAGGIIVILGFLLPQSKNKVSDETKKLVREEIKTLVSQEMDGIKSHVDDVVDEAVGYAVEKTERSLERLSNEKIMAVNEYSDTVLQEIHKNHEEVMFLYDMLNSKHTKLKDAVSEVNQAVKEAEETRNEAEAMVNSYKKMKAESQAVSVDSSDFSTVFTDNFRSMGRMQEEHSEEIPAFVPDVNSDLQSVVDSNLLQELDEQDNNSNDRILELYRQGKSDVTIAKELGIGVGEVQLVIGLYKNM